MGLPRLYKNEFIHPVDMVENIAINRGWLFDRSTYSEIAINISTENTNYELTFVWLEEQEILHVVCAFDNHTPSIRQPAMQSLLLQINSRMIMGHFDYWSDTHIIVFRQALTLAGNVRPSASQIDTLLKAVEICESHYQAFRLVSIVGLSAEAALKCCLFETKGSA